ncbi:MAG: hypothetical protein ACK4TA_21200 [Saprospiraceae bacterium]
MQVNSFKRLEEDAEQIYSERHEERVKAGILNSLNAVRLVGHVLDMYLPKIFNLFIVAAGGKVTNQAYHPSSTPPSDMIDDQMKSRGPGGPDTEQIIR